MLLTDILKKSARRFSSHKALTMRMGYRTRTLTYAQAYEFSQKVAVFLQQQGLQKGDCVIVLAPNSPHWICLFWGCLLAGVVIVPVTVQSTPDMVQRFATHTGAKLFFKYRICHVELDGVPSYYLEFLDEFVTAYDTSAFKTVEILPDDVVQILYTSGTTGDPKGTMLTHKNITSNVEAMSTLFKVDGTKERFLSILPLSHIYEQSFGFIMPYAYGVHIIYMHAPSAIRDLMQQYRITKMLAVPEFLKLFMNKIEAAAQEKGRLNMLERMRKVAQAIGWAWFSRLLFRSVLKQFGGKLDVITSGGAPLDPLLELKWEAFGVKILQGYGLTETSPIVSTNYPGVKRLGSVGKVVPGVQVKLADDGEILVKGPSVFKGYFKAPEKTQEAFTPDGFFKTGDIGFFDHDGFMYLKGRKKYMILGSGGQNVYPDDIEQELNELPEVKDSCVIGLEQAGGHVEIHAVLLLNKDVHDPKKIIDQANEKLASYQRINGFTVWPDLDFPRSATRKIKKHEVTKVVQDRASATVKSDGYVKTPLVKILVQISGKGFADVLPTTKIVQDLSLDSLSLVEMVIRIEEAYAVTIDETAIDAKTTVTDVEQLIKDAGKAAQRPKLKRWPRFGWIKGIRFIGQQIIFLMMRLFVKYDIKGLEHLKDLDHPVIFMPNHTSYFDSIALAQALPNRFRLNVAFAAAQDVLYGEFKRIAWLAELLMGSFPFPRKEKQNIKQGLDAIGQLLDQGCNIVLFPEGYISKDGTLQELKKGAGLVAVEMGVMVVPLVIQGAQDIFPYDSFKPVKRGVIKITFGKPMVFSKQMHYDDAAKAIEASMKALR